MQLRAERDGQRDKNIGFEKGTPARSGSKME